MFCLCQFPILTKSNIMNNLTSPILYLLFLIIPTSKGYFVSVKIIASKNIILRGTKNGFSLLFYYYKPLGELYSPPAETLCHCCSWPPLWFFLLPSAGFHTRSTAPPGLWSGPSGGSPLHRGRADTHTASHSMEPAERKSIISQNLSMMSSRYICPYNLIALIQLN